MYYRSIRSAHLKRVIESAIRLVIAMIIALVLGGFSPVAIPSPALADTNPVDLQLDSEGTMPFIVSNIKPEDTGTKTVALHNAGTKDGFVVIWLSDTVNSEGENPESETGNTAEPGELDDNMLLNITGGNLQTGMALPATVKNFPHDIADPNFVELPLMQVGETISLQWNWELPKYTGNDAQGDSISFTINYLLREIPYTDVSETVTDDGLFTEEVTIKTEEKFGEVTIPENTTSQTKEGEPPTVIWLVEIDKTRANVSESTAVVSLQYEAGPDGLTFDKPITLTLNYDPYSQIAAAQEDSLFIATWDNTAHEWIKLENRTIDKKNKTISAQVLHFSRYTVIAPVPPAPEPVTDTGGGGGGGYSPEPVSVTDKEGAENVVLRIDTLGDKSVAEVGADGTVRKPLTITERNGNFAIYVDSGTKILGANSTPPSRIEMTIADEAITAPDDIVILSPVYRVTGYTNELQSTRINFTPSAVLTIRYDPRNLPENSLLPFVAYYDADEGLVPIEPPAGATVEIGKVKALISHASLFLAAVTRVPVPPPLPPTFELSKLTINPWKSKVGEPVIITLEIANTGETTGSYELQLKIDGIIRAIREINIAAGSRETISFEINNLSVGRHEIEVAGLSEQFQTISTAILPATSEFDWHLLDLAIGGGVFAGLLILYWLRQRMGQRSNK